MWQSVDAPLINGHYLDKNHDGGVLNSFNLGSYSYARNNPIIYIDPDGNQYVTRTITYNGNGTIKSVHDRLYYKDRKARAATVSENKAIAQGRGRVSFEGVFGYHPESLAHGPEGPGIMYIHKKADGSVKKVMTFDSTLGNHGIYSGAGAITKDGSRRNYDFNFQPIDMADAIAKVHDQAYPNDALYLDLGFSEDTRTLCADLEMVRMINQALNGASASEIGVETPFNTFMGHETLNALENQRTFIGILAHYKQWKIDNGIIGRASTGKEFTKYALSHPINAALISIADD